MDENGQVKLVLATATVTFDSDEINFATVDGAFEYANGLETTENNFAEIKLLGNVAASATLTVDETSVITLDLNGFMLRNSRTIDVFGKLTLIDSSENKADEEKVAHRYYIDRLSGHWVFVDEDFENTQGYEIKTLKGGVIYGGYVQQGGGVHVDGGEFTMESGVIAGGRASEGGGVYVYDGNFYMKGGAICGNRANIGGGVYVMGSTFEMSGGEISGNTSGVYFIGVEFKISGKPIITNNKGAVINNVYSEGYAKITVDGTLEYGATIGINRTGAVAIGFTQNDKPSTFFIPDRSEYNCVYVSDVSNGTVSVGTHTASTAWAYDDNTHWHPCSNNCGEKYNEANHSGTDDGDVTTALICEDCGGVMMEAMFTEVKFNGETSYYPTVKAAFDYANGLATTENKVAEIMLLTNVSTDNTLTVEEGKFITLDLNGCILKRTGSGSVITVSGNFTLIDGNEQKKHYYTVNANGLWVFDDEADGTEFFGGVITGGYDPQYGGGAYVGGGGVCVNRGNFTMESGNICGNEAQNAGGGVYMYSGSFIMHNGSICGNRAYQGGGVHISSGSFIMYNGSISKNIAEGYTGGVQVQGSFTMYDGLISENRADTTNGGGLCVYGSFTMNGGTITGNKSVQNGGGVFVVAGKTVKISGASVIIGNKMGSEEDNVALFVGTTSEAKIEITGPLYDEDGNKAQIGVSKKTATGYSGGAFATGYTQSDAPSQYLVSDKPEYGCIYISDEASGTVYIGVHNFNNAPWQSNDDTHWHECQNGCGSTVDDDLHNYNQEIVSEEYLKSAATCAAKAVYYLSCECGAHGEETFEYGNLLDHHNPAASVRENEVGATCSKTGSYDEVVYCYDCHKELSRTPKTIDKIPHTEEVVPAVAATCSATGLTEGKKCSVCDETLVAQVATEKLAHTKEVVPAVAATCTATGLTEGKKCSVCDETLVAQVVTDKIAHTEEVVPAVAATCTATGLTEGKKCSVCDETLVAQTVVNALGHDFSTEFTVDKEATCTESGLKSKHCSRCDERSEETEIAVIPHSIIHHLPNSATENIVGNIEYWECEECEKFFEDENGEKEIEDKTSVVLPVVTPPDNPNPPEGNEPDNNGGGEITEAPKKGLSGGAIAGITIGVILFVLIAAYLVGYFVFYRRGILKGRAYDVMYAPMNAIFGKPRTSD